MFLKPSPCILPEKEGKHSFSPFSFEGGRHEEFKSNRSFLFFTLSLTIVICFFYRESLSAQDIPVNKYGLQVITDTQLYTKLIEKNHNNLLVDLTEFLPGLKIDIRYATTKNFTGKILYSKAKAYARYPVAKALEQIRKELRSINLDIKIYDAYRPYSTTVIMWDYVKDDRYVAAPEKGSRHNRGCAIDLTLIDLITGNEIEMPTPYDDFSGKAHLNYNDLPENVLRNKKILIDIMSKFNFSPISSEWWHYDFKGWEQYYLMDISFEHLETIH